ncbi:hypothetical protein PO124_28045 [Bacillus licheniformis]|nr:hypothetical protein [Bacillus licheniformis]
MMRNPIIKAYSRNRKQQERGLRNTEPRSNGFVQLAGMVAARSGRGY